MKVPYYNLKGEKVGEIFLSEEVFSVPLNETLLWQGVRYYELKKRKPWAHTKDRSEVKGGGRKPWSQKGTGRSRHGSIRSPLWKGGGVTFGPRKEKIYEIKFPKKMKKKALAIVLSQKLKDGEIIFVDKIKISRGKTKEVKEILESLSKIRKDLSQKKVCFILEKKDEKFIRAQKNLKNTSTLPSDSLNLYFLLQKKYLIIEKSAIENIKKLCKLEKNLKS